MKIVLSILLVLSLASCASVKEFISGTAKVGTATVLFPECRAEYEKDVPDSIKAQVQTEFDNLDTLIIELSDVRKGNPDISFLDGLDKVIEGPGTADNIGMDFNKISSNTKSYYTAARKRNEFLISCDNYLRDAYEVIRSNGKLEDFLREVGPYAKVAGRLAIKAATGL